MVDSSVFGLISLYKHYKNSVMPVSGGILEQKNYYIKAMELIDGVINEK